MKVCRSVCQKCSDLGQVSMSKINYYQLEMKVDGMETPQSGESRAAKFRYRLTGENIPNLLARHTRFAVRPSALWGDSVPSTIDVNYFIFNFLCLLKMFIACVQ